MKRTKMFKLNLGVTKMTKSLKVSIFILFAFLLSSKTLFSQTNFWEPTSELNIRVYSMAITSNGDLWVGGMGKEIYRSTNNGDTWSSFDVMSSTSSSCQSIAVNPVNGYIFASTTEGFYRSTNNGQNWECVHVGYIAREILCTRFGEIYMVDEGVLYSTDMGITWISKSNGLSSYGRCLVQGTDGTLYAGTNDGVYRSTDGGDNWLPPTNYNNSVATTGLTIADDGSIFASVNYYGILKSTDKGITWTQVINGLGDYYYGGKIKYNPKTGHIFVTDMAYFEVYRSTDLGANWYKLNNGILSYSVNGFVVNPITGTMFVGCASVSEPNVYRSTENINIVLGLDLATSIDFGTVQLSSYKDSAIYITNTSAIDVEITAVNIKGNLPFSYSFTNSLTLRPNETQRLAVTFTPSSLGLHQAYLNITTSIATLAVLLTGNGIPGVPEIGINSTSINFGDVPVSFASTKTLEVTNNGNNNLIISSLSFTGSNADLFSFSSNHSLPITLTPSQSVNIAILFSPTSVGTKNAELNIIHNASETPLIVPLYGNGITPSVNVAPTSINFGTVKVSSDKDSAIYITNTGTTDIVITAVNIRGNDASSFLHIFTSTVIRPNETQRFSVVFRPYTVGAKTATMEFITNIGSAGIITLNGSCTVDGLVSVEKPEIPTTYSLMQNYPNPFNPTTKIQYSLPEASHVRLSVYNSMGQEVIQLVNENQSAGKYIVDFNAQNLQSGVYLYRLQTGKFVETKKMLLIK